MNVHVEVDLAQRLVHHPPEHFREPVESAGEHAEDGRHAHDHVEMAHHEVGVVEVQVQRRLAQEDAAQPAGDE